MLGLVFIAHGIDKLFFPGMDDTIGQFSAWGIPQPQIFGWIVAIGELVAGGLLCYWAVGYFRSGMLAVLCALSVYFVHWGQWIFRGRGGFRIHSCIVRGIIDCCGIQFWSCEDLDGVLSRVESLTRSDALSARHGW